MPPKGRRSIQNNKVICTQCNLEIKDDDEFIECDKCSKKYHVVCTALNKREYEYLLKHEEEEFVCHLCDGNNNNNSGTLKKELNEIKTELKKLDQLSNLHEAMTFMSKQYDDILRGVAENKKKLENVQKENKMLKEEIKTLQNSVRFLNDQRVRNDCLIRGVKVIDGMSAADTVLKLSSDAGVELQPEVIDEAYFIKRRNTSSEKKNENNEGKQVMVVKFNSKKAKDTMMSIKPKLMENELTKKVFVNDYLSRETMSLLNYAKSLKQVGYRSVYVVGGKVFIKRSELSKPKIIRSEEEIDDLLLEAATNKQKRRSQHLAPDEDFNDV